jgi:hypothetical protein
MWREARSARSRVSWCCWPSLMGGVITFGRISNDAAPSSDVAELEAAARYEAGSATFCVADPQRGFDPPPG